MPPSADQAYREAHDALLALLEDLVPTDIVGAQAYAALDATCRAAFAAGAGNATEADFHARIARAYAQEAVRLNQED